MTLRDELERVLGLLKGACVSDTRAAWEEFDSETTDFLRDHGPALLEALDKDATHVVVTRDKCGEIVAVTRQDDEGRVVAVIAEKLTDAERAEHIAEYERVVEAIDRARGGGE